MQRTADRLSLTLSALADPTRRAILARLSLGAATVNEIAAPFGISLPSISLTVAPPRLRRARIARRVGSASAERVRLRGSAVRCIFIDPAN